MSASNRATGPGGALPWTVLLALAWILSVAVIVRAMPASGTRPTPAEPGSSTTAGGPAARPAAPRPLTGLGVRYGGSVAAARDAFGGPVAARDLDRIARLGATFVVIDVHVPVAARGERRDPGTELTLEGDRAVVDVIAQAHAAGLAAAVWPRTMASPTGPRLDWQVFSGFDDLEDAFARELEARVAAAELAARSGADAVFLLDGFWLPTAPDFASRTGEEGRRVDLEAALRADLEERTASLGLPRLAHFPGLDLVRPTVDADGALPAAFRLSASLDGPLSGGTKAEDVELHRSRIRRATEAGARLLTVALPEHDRAGRRGLEGVGGRASSTEREEALMALAEAWGPGTPDAALLLETYGIGGGGERGSHDVADLSEEVWRALAEALAPR